MPRPRAIVAFRRLDNIHGETLIFQPIMCTRQTRRKLVKEMRDMLYAVGLTRRAVSFDDEPVSMNDPDPVPFADAINGQAPAYRHIKVQAGHPTMVHTTSNRYDRRQARLLKRMFFDVLNRLNIRVHRVSWT